MLNRFLSEDKTSMIKKLVLPDIKDQKEKEAYKQTLIAFFKSHSNFENKVDWNKFKVLTKKDFDEVIASADQTKSAQKRKEKEEITSDIKNIFKSQKGREFFIPGENARWLFVAPLNYEAAKFCDSSENQGAGAKWCIGYEKTDEYWNSYIDGGSLFIMAFNKNYRNLSKKDLDTKLKFMIQRDDEGKYHVWDQSDEDTGDDLSVFGKEKQVADKMFGAVEKEFAKIEEKESEKANEETEKYLKDLVNKNITKVSHKKIFERATKIEIPEGIKTIGKKAFYRCSRLTSITIPDGVTSIGNSAFSRCSGLASITIPNGVTSIRDWAFYHCSGLTSVTIPDSVTRIGWGAFSNCHNLMSTTIPEGMISIELYAFRPCLKLSTIYCSKNIFNKFRKSFPQNAVRKDPELKKENLNKESTNMKKTYKIKNYKGNIVESLSRFSKSHKGMKIVEACEEKDELKIKAEESKKIEESANEILEVPKTVGEFVELLKKYSPDKKLDIWITEYDYGDLSETESYNMRINDMASDYIEITFAYGDKFFK